MKALVTLFTLMTYTLNGYIETQPRWNEDLSFEEIEDRLRTESVINASSIHAFLKQQNKKPSGMHPIKIATLESGLLAVLKKENACYGEVAAYKAAKVLNLRLVPPTVLRDINGTKGSLQFYVDCSVDLAKYHSLLQKASRKDRSDMNVFYFLFNQWDDHRGNQLIDKDKKKFRLVLIDNQGISFLSHDVKLKERVFWASTVRAVQRLDRKKLSYIWSDLIDRDPERVEALIERTLQRREQFLSILHESKIVDDL